MAGFALLFPMNELFERFVGRCVQRALAPGRVQLQAQSEHALTGEREGELLFALRPDAVVRHSGGCIILDTKWKPLKPEQDDLGVLSGDVYQMLAYGQAHNAARVVLIYPGHKEIGYAEGVIRRWTANVAKRFPIHVATVDVGRPKDVPDTLFKIVNDVSDGDTCLQPKG